MSESWRIGLFGAWISCVLFYYSILFGRKKTKDFKIRFVVGTAFFVICLAPILLWYETPNESTNNQVVLTQPQSGSYPNTASTSPKLVPQSIKEDDPAKPYSLDLSYPSVDGDEQISQQIKNYVESITSEFMGDIPTNYKLMKPKYRMDIFLVYKTYRADDRILSFKFDGNAGDNQMAHPARIIDSYTYSYKLGRKVELIDLFTPDSNYLNKISNIAVQSLNSKYGSGKWTIEGASPKAQNFSKLVLDQNNLIILFDDYQVTAHAEGPPEVTIPFTEVKNILSGVVN